MPGERIEFEGHTGARLAARLDLPEGPVRATALFAHCFTCGKDIRAAREIAGRLAERGFAVLRFDFTGLGSSEGEFGNTGFTANVMDIAAAARHLADMGRAPSLLVGHSLGGAAVLAAAGEIASVRAVATIGAPAHPSHVLHHFEEHLPDILEKGHAIVTLGGRSFEICRTFVADMSEAMILDRIAGMKRALLVLHAPRDETVGIENASAIFGAAKHPKSFVTLDGADHLLTRAEDAAYAAEVISAWAGRYLEPAPAAEAAEAAEGPAEGVVRVSETDPAGYRQVVALGPRHRLIADEPVAAGGTDAGPSPYDLLSAALGTCTAMTIRMYARRKGLPLASVEVDVAHEKIHAADCAECETKEGKVDVFRRRIALRGALSEADRARLLEIADRCPVHRTLHSEVRVETVAV